VLGETGETYVITRALEVQGDFRIELRGTILKPVGPVWNLLHRTVPEGTGYPITQGQQMGSSLLVLQGDSMPKKADLVRLKITAMAGRLPPSYRHILEVKGNQVRLDLPEDSRPNSAWPKTGFLSFFFIPKAIFEARYKYKVAGSIGLVNLKD